MKELREEFKKKYGNRVSEYSVNIANWWIEKLESQKEETMIKIRRKWNELSEIRDGTVDGDGNFIDAFDEYLLDNLKE